MQILCNGEPRQLGDGATLSSLLEQLRFSGPVAVEVNEQLVPREKHARHELSDGDRVEVVTLVGGG